jgi:hypothetical protein
MGRDNTLRVRSIVSVDYTAGVELSDLKDKYRVLW